MRKTLRNIVLGLGLFAAGCGGGGGGGGNPDNPAYTRSEAITYLKTELENKGYAVLENQFQSLLNENAGNYVDNVYELYGMRGSCEFYLDIPEIIPDNVLEDLKDSRTVPEPYISIVYELDKASLDWTIEDIVSH